jgi:hypothetical protein
MTKGQRAAIENYTRKGFSVDMIGRLMARTGLLLKSSEIKAIIETAGLLPINDHSGDRGFRASPIEMKRYEDPGRLRARWVDLLPGIKEKLRAEIRHDLLRKG